MKKLPNLSGILVDLTPLRTSLPFRRLWLASLVVGVGGQMGLFAVALQVYDISGSSLAVGAVGIFVAIPSILFTMFGGVLADAIDRRILAMSASFCQFVVAGSFYLQATFSYNSLAVIYILIALQATIGAFSVPARRAFIRRLLPVEQMPAALALYMFSMQFSQILGPATAGVVSSLIGVKYCFLFQIFSFFVFFAVAWSLPATLPSGIPIQLKLRAVGEAISFVWRNQVLRGAFFADLCITIFGIPTALFPAINCERFGGQPITLGLLTTSFAVGGVLGTAFSGLLGKLTYQGRAMLTACVTWGILIVAFGFSENLWFALLCLTLAGAADVIAATLVQTIVQNSTPDILRGRISAVEQIIQMGGPQLGNFRAGLTGSWFDPPLGVILGGLATIIGIGIVFISLPNLVKYSSGDDLHN
ncbi:hypothetical protein SB2_17845 [Methylobacterium radiotolerans]|nr:hypothetical protein SB3_16140 [Methylobacterium radiotolerans]KTS46353.1 hypothetical protein SB2_17845 [Methylobacterium radiotolerans]